MRPPLFLFINQPKRSLTAWVSVDTTISTVLPACCRKASSMLGILCGTVVLVLLDLTLEIALHRGLGVLSGLLVLENQQSQLLTGTAGRSGVPLRR